MADVYGMLGDLLDRVDTYRMLHSEAEAGGKPDLLNDAYVNMLVEADKIAAYMRQVSEHPTWESNLDDRQLKEVKFARLYTADFKHGTDGHNRLILIALMADLLDKAEVFGNEPE